MAVSDQTNTEALAQAIKAALDFARDVDDHETALTLAQVLEAVRSPAQAKPAAEAAGTLTELWKEAAASSVTIHHKTDCP